MCKFYCYGPRLSNSFSGNVTSWNCSKTIVVWVTVTLEPLCTVIVCGCVCVCVCLWSHLRVELWCSADSVGISMPLHASLFRCTVHVGVIAIHYYLGNDHQALDDWSIHMTAIFPAISCYNKNMWNVKRLDVLLSSVNIKQEFVK